MSSSATLRTMPRPVPEEPRDDLGRGRASRASDKLRWRWQNALSPGLAGALMAAGKQPLINRAFHRAELAQVDDTALATILGDTANTMFLRGT